MKAFLMQNGQPVEIKRSSELNVKLSIELEDPYKAFKDKLKAQVKGKIGK